MTELKPRKEKILTFSVSLIVVLYLIGLAIRNQITGYDGIDRIASLIITIFSVLFLSPPLVLSVTYLYTDLTKKIFVDGNKIIIKKRGKITEITKEDVMDSFYVKVDDDLKYRRYSFYWYKYIAIILKERKRVFITNLLCEPELIIKTLELNNKMIFTAFPFIKLTLGSGVLTSREYETKVHGFENQFDGFTNARLTEITANKSTYDDCAREAASRILNNRKH